MIDPSLITSVDPPPSGDHLNTANHRAWRHIIEMRTSVHAEEEIRVIIGDVAQQLKDKFPTIYGDMDKNGVDEWVFTHSKV